MRMEAMKWRWSLVHYGFGTDSTTSVEFQFKAPNGNFYQLQTDNNPPASISGSGATRTVMYNGTATLSPLVNGNAKTPIGSTSFPFQFAVTKCTTVGVPLVRPASLSMTEQ